jgi:DNA-binding NtrC family response regulator
MDLPRSFGSQPSNPISSSPISCYREPQVPACSSVNPADAEEARRLGACDFVAKPIDLEEFTETLWGIIWKWALRDQQAKT